jgi:hypothetical protein
VTADSRLLALCIVPLVLIATANAAGYRYGASDLAFYGPAVMRHLDPRLFPRDRPIIEAQSRLTLMDESVGTLARMTTRHLPTLFLALYCLSIVLMAASATAVGGVLYTQRWTVAALMMALTVRHAIPKSGTNTLEAYFHPRQLAFWFGALAVGAFLRGRPVGVLLGIGAAALLHPTTTLWFAIWLAVAALVAGTRVRRPLLVAAAVCVPIGIWAIAAGPLTGRFVRMDDDWVAAIGSKDYLFPLAWPIYAWVLNAGYAVVIALLYRQRSAAGLASERERAVVIGCLSLAAVFLAAVAFQSARLALAIQLQPARVFWMLDLLAIAYLIWAAAEWRRPSPRRAAAVAAIVAAMAIARGAYVMGVEFPDRPLFEAGVPGDWGRVMAWARATPLESGWLAHPDHASRYGTSVRMAAGRDVFVEGVKDTAIGMYDRSIAMRTRDRLQELDRLEEWPPARIRAFGARHGIDYYVTEQMLDLPLAFSSGPLRVYRIR